MQRGTRRSGSFQDEAIAGRAGRPGKRDDLIGKKVALDDHVALLRARGPGDEPDELQLKRTNITFLVPRQAASDGTTQMTAALVQGVLRRDGTRLVCDVTELKAVAGDLDRLENGVQGPEREGFGNAEGVGALGRAPCARLQERSAHAKRAHELEAEAVPDRNRDEAAGGGRTRRVAGDGEGRPAPKVPEPEPAALAHRALCGASSRRRQTLPIIEDDRFGRSRSSSRKRRTIAIRRGRTWRGGKRSMRKTRPAAYREAPESQRRAFDRRLWADASERLINLQTHRRHSRRRSPRRNAPGHCSPKKRSSPRD